MSGNLTLRRFNAGARRGCNQLRSVEIFTKDSHMSHFAIVCPDEAGPLLAIGPVGKELVRRGHSVTIVAPQWAVPLAKLLDLPLHLLASETIPQPSSFILSQASRLVGLSGE